MPAQGQVKLWHQIVLLFIPFAAIWAFYRIEKLTKALLYISLPSFAVQGVMAIIMTSLIDTIDPVVSILLSLVTLPLTVWAIYLIVRWTREWNAKFPEKIG